MYRLDSKIGERFGKLVVIRKMFAVSADGCQQVECLCDCGTICIKEYAKMRNRSIRSCGCLRGLKHGEAAEGHRTPEYNTWSCMKSRCLSPNDGRYKDYSGRGISICDRWRVYTNFLADMGRKPGREYSLDRINNDGNYEPNNCRWATKAEQSRNQRPCHVTASELADMQNQLEAYQHLFGCIDQYLGYL